MTLREISVNAHKDSSIIATIHPYDHELRIFIHHVEKPEIYLVVDINDEKATITVYEGHENVKVQYEKKEKQ